jgi:hypothetical protein
MQRSIIFSAALLTICSLAACNRERSVPPTPTAKPDTITPAPVRPGDPSTPAVPGPNTPQPQMPDAQKK